MIQVGKNYGTSKERVRWGYPDVTYTDGWARTDQWLPMDYDIVIMKVGDKEIPGWFTKDKWEGIRLKKTDKVTHWKKPERECG